ncbi:GmrSD restriction endonuclease domain-containing protein [Streptomyces longwoodensis]|uniref:HNH endonuclease family protein n=1 Tax=Streptomyces longwoodensis TaxID=68231 RepID=UPI00099E913B
MRFTPAVAAAIAFTAVLLPATAQAAPAHARHREAGQSVTLPVREALTHIAVADEDRTGYQRSAFKHWVDADRDGCSTRAEVLKAEAVTAPEQGPRCALSGGQWYSPYDDRYIQGPTGLDIDHLVPLAEAWDSGASTWSAAEREAYANDLGDDRALIAVSAASNRSKADQDPTTWMPPAEGYRCQYATDWIADKLRWSLNLDEAEKVALTDILARCSNVPITVTLAR